MLRMISMKTQVSFANLGHPVLLIHSVLLVLGPGKKPGVSYPLSRAYWVTVTVTAADVEPV